MTSHQPMSAERAERPGILSLLPELYPNIASSLPLQIVPSTLLSLALTTSKIYRHAHAVLYSHVIATTEEQAFKLLRKIAKEKHLGLLVRELYIMFKLSGDTRKKGNGRTVLAELHEIIKSGHLPGLHTLGLTLAHGWYSDEHLNVLEGYDQLPRSFWGHLEKECCLRTLYLHGIGETSSYPWIGESEILTVCHCYKLQHFDDRFYIT